jgi:hypothetical protein
MTNFLFIGKKGIFCLFFLSTSLSTFMISRKTPLSPPSSPPPPPIVSVEVNHQIYGEEEMSHPAFKKGKTVRTKKKTADS